MLSVEFYFLFVHLFIYLPFYSKNMQSLILNYFLGYFPMSPAVHPGFLNSPALSFTPTSFCG